MHLTAPSQQRYILSQPHHTFSSLFPGLYQTNDEVHLHCLHFARYGRGRQTGRSGGADWRKASGTPMCSSYAVSYEYAQRRLQIQESNVGKGGVPKTLMVFTNQVGKWLEASRRARLPYSVVKNHQVKQGVRLTHTAAGAASSPAKNHPPSGLACSVVPNPILRAPGCRRSAPSSD